PESAGTCRVATCILSRSFSSPLKPAYPRAGTRQPAAALEFCAGCPGISPGAREGSGCPPLPCVCGPTSTLGDNTRRSDCRFPGAALLGVHLLRDTHGPNHHFDPSKPGDKQAAELLDDLPFH